MSSILILSFKPTLFFREDRMKHRFLKIIIAGFFILLPYTSYAAGLCCQLSSGVQESLSGVAAPGAEEFSLQFNYSFSRMNKFREGGAERSLDYVKDVFFPRYTSFPIDMDMIKYTM